MPTAWAPGRVNLIGDHVDYLGGPVLPMALDLGTTVIFETATFETATFETATFETATFETGGDVVRLTSSSENEPAEVPIGVTDPAGVEPAWARYVAGVVAELGSASATSGVVATRWGAVARAAELAEFGPATGAGGVPSLKARMTGLGGGRGTVETTLPVGAGLSSSAALTIAVALALGFEGDPIELARLGQRAEQRATGVPCGVMDQFASVAGVAGCALLIDCATLEVTPLPLPEGIEVLVVHSGQARTLVGSAYGERRAACEAAAARVGPLPHASRADIERLADPVLRRRARHVVTECERVRTVAASGFERSVLADALAASHASLRDDFEVSTPALDALVHHLSAQPGVIGARLTGAGFGGCVVALIEAGAAARIDVGDHRSWLVRPSGGARLLSR